MDEDGLPIMGSGVDLTKVPAIQQRKIVAFLNQYVVHTVRFLNRFSTVCEEKLATASLRTQQIETTLSMLEAKLASVPGLEDVAADGVRPAAQTKGPAVVPSHVTGLHPEEARGVRQDPQTETPVETVAKDPRYARYLKMVQVGVPVVAIKNKMVLEGLDPGLLDNPEAPVPDSGQKAMEDKDDGSSGSESSFSD